MVFEISTIETDKKIENQEIMVSKNDVKYVNEIMEKIEKEEITEKINLSEYNSRQKDEMLSDPNRYLAVLKKSEENKKIDDIEVSEQEMGMSFIEEDEYGFSLAFLYSIRNMQFRNDITKDQLLENYRKMKRKIEIGLKKYEQDKRV